MVVIKEFSFPIPMMLLMESLLLIIDLFHLWNNLQKQNETLNGSLNCSMEKLFQQGVEFLLQQYWLLLLVDNFSILLFRMHLLFHASMFPNSL